MPLGRVADLRRQGLRAAGLSTTPRGSGGERVGPGRRTPRCASKLRMCGGSKSAKEMLVVERRGGPGWRCSAGLRVWVLEGSWDSEGLEAEAGQGASLRSALAACAVSTRGPGGESRCVNPFILPGGVADICLAPFCRYGDIWVHVVSSVLRCRATRRYTVYPPLCPHPSCDVGGQMRT